MKLAHNLNRLLFSALFLCSFNQQLYSQISRGGSPLDWENKSIDLEIPFAQTAVVDLSLLQAEDAITDQYKEVPYRFGVEHEVQFDISNSGEWKIFPSENIAIWQLGIRCPDALSVSLLFTDFQLPKGARLFIWTADRQQFLGAFDHHDNNPSHVFATGLLHSDAVIIEYQVSLDGDWGTLKLGEIVHGYRPILKDHFLEADLSRGPFGGSGACNINVNCPEGADWQVEKQSVALIVEGGSALCTGALVNNTAQDGTPYFLTANHCLGGNVATWVYYFNHENDDCSGSTGPTSYSISGSTLKASNGGSDFALLELNDAPPANWNIQYAGWDNSDLESAAVSAVGIHHPSGDVKKICFEEDAPYHDFSGGAEVWWIDDWELGVTEPGSSGSPLFNQDHRIIGQLYGGASACAGSVNNGLYDFYGRFGVSWDNGNSASSRLRDWLDPGNSGITTLDGWPTGFVSYDYDAGVTQVNGITASVCSSTASPVVTLRNYGLIPLTSATIIYSLNGTELGEMNWAGNLLQNQQEQVELPVINLFNGNNDFEVVVSNPNGQADQNDNNDDVSISFNAITGEVYDITVSILLDEFPEETSWAIMDGNNVLWSGEGYNQAGGTIEDVVCLAVGCYDFVIYDSYGDGICCDWGNGSYSVLDSEGDVLISGGSFGNSESNQICVVTSIEEALKLSEISIFPNPASDFIRVETELEEGFGFELFDCTGRMVFASETMLENQVVPVHNIPAGTYRAVIKSGGSKVSSLLVILH